MRNADKLRTVRTKRNRMIAFLIAFHLLSSSFLDFWIDSGLRITYSHPDDEKQ
jgi:hypothetical protein